MSGSVIGVQRDDGGEGAVGRGTARKGEDKKVKRAKKQKRKKKERSEERE